MNTLKSVRSMVTTAAIAAIIVVMASVPFLGYIPLGFMNATIIHVPVIIGAEIRSVPWTRVWSHQCDPGNHNPERHILCILPVCEYQRLRRKRVESGDRHCAESSDRSGGLLCICSDDEIFQR